MDYQVKLDDMRYVAREEERVDATKKIIKLSGRLDTSNDFVSRQLTEDYGSYFSRKELKRFIKNN